jgi:hypothetical protein
LLVSFFPLTIGNVLSKIGGLRFVYNDLLMKTACPVWVCELLRRDERKGALKKWFWMMILATAELYGGTYPTPLYIFCFVYSPFPSSLICEFFVIRRMWVPSDVFVGEHGINLGADVLF